MLWPEVSAETNFFFFLVKKEEKESHTHIPISAQDILENSLFQIDYPSVVIH